MLHIFSNSQIVDLERLTIGRGTTELELMVRAARSYCTWIGGLVPPTQHIDVLCGKSNNGADGLHISKLLYMSGYRVRVLLIDSDAYSPANQKIQEQLYERGEIEIITIKEAEDITNLSKVNILIDALLGLGVNRPLKGSLAQIVKKCNDLYEDIYAVDLPSGLGEFTTKGDIVMNCASTLSFELPKKALLNPDNITFSGNWFYRSIGIYLDNLTNFYTNTFLVVRNDITRKLIGRKINIHKGQLGRVLHIINDAHMFGAGVISALASMSAGVGITYGLTISRGKIMVPEIAWIVDLTDNILKKIDVISIGPGLGLSRDAEVILDKVLSTKGVKLVLDADALNVISQKGWIDRLPPRSIITPHIGEFKNLFGDISDHRQRIEEQRNQCVNRGIYIVLKGPYTSVGTPEGNIYYVTQGSPALAKGGTGDVLTGVIASLLAQGMDEEEASYVGTYIHGLAGKLYSLDHHEATLTPLRLIDYIDKALLNLTQ